MVLEVDLDAAIAMVITVANEEERIRKEHGDEYFEDALAQSYHLFPVLCESGHWASQDKRNELARAGFIVRGKLHRLLGKDLEK